MPRPSRLPELIAISDRQGLGEAIPVWARRLDRAGVPALLIREKDLDDRALFELVCEVVATVEQAQVLVSARPDVALAAGADGVHLSAAGLPTEAVVARFGAELLVGRSTHSVEEVATAGAEGADYVFFSPTWATPSKAGLGPPAGLDELARSSRLGVAVLALGGVTLERFALAAAAGARGVAGIRLFRDGESIETLVTRARTTFSRPAWKGTE
ncbi:MAG TPA: thiamine phosphate synthase [Thermoanaerobaculia bacterium]|nr:thiamine phosphate synthase [Thermoanaerobaculia bacterium]